MKKSKIKKIIKTYLNKRISAFPNVIHSYVEILLMNQRLFIV